MNILANETKQTPFIIKCAVSSYPRANVTFTRLGETLNNTNPRVEVTAAEDGDTVTYTLTLSSVTFSDAAEYFCRASNGNQGQPQKMKVGVIHLAGKSNEINENNYSLKAMAEWSKTSELQTKESRFKFPLLLSSVSLKDSRASWKQLKVWLLGYSLKYRIYLSIYHHKRISNNSDIIEAVADHKDSLCDDVNRNKILLLYQFHRTRMFEQSDWSLQTIAMPKQREMYFNDIVW